MADRKTHQEVVRRTLEMLAQSREEQSKHDCWVSERSAPVVKDSLTTGFRPYKSNGALGHGWECGVCGKFLQAG